MTVLKVNHTLRLLTVGLSAWLVPGAGYLLLKEKKRAIIIFAAVTATFCTGLYLGSIGVIDLTEATPWYVYMAQIMASPVVAALGNLTAGGAYLVSGWPREIGQIYTAAAGLLNLLCIVNSVYLAHLHGAETAGG